MLVLSRQKQESIMIRDDIEIMIVDICGNKVRLGINAPSDIPVHRKEVYEAIQQKEVCTKKNMKKDRRKVKGRKNERPI